MIGVVRLDRIGDTVLTLPAIKIIKQKYADQKIVGIFNDYNSKLFVYNSKLIYPYIDVLEIIPIKLVYRSLEIFSNIYDLFNYLKVLFWKNRKNYNFERLFVFSPTTVSYLLGNLIKAQRKYTYFYGSRFNKNIFAKDFIHYIDNIDKSFMEDYGKVRHELFQNLEVVQLDFDFDISNLDQFKPEIFLPDITYPEYDLLIFDKELFFNSSVGIEWFKKFIFQFMKEVEKSGKKMKVGFVSRRTDLFGFAVNHDIIEIAGMVKNCKCVVCFDGGIVHIASSFDTPIVAIFTNRYFEFDLRRWGPLSTKQTIIRLDIFDNDNLNFDLTDPIDFAKHVFFYAERYI